MSLAEYHLSRLTGDVSGIDRFICVSAFQKELMARAGIDQNKLVTLHNFVDPAQLGPQEPVERGDYFLYFGRIEELKGMATLIEAARRTGVELRIAGTGSWSAKLEAEVSELSNVSYLGFVSGEPLKELVAGARAVVVPSEWYENCPMSVLEAKAVGTPVIGTRIGGIPELVRDGVDGVLFEAGDVDSLSEAFSRFDTADETSWQDAARDDVNQRFSPTAHLTALREIYAEVS